MVELKRVDRLGLILRGSLRTMSPSKMEMGYRVNSPMMSDWVFLPPKTAS